MSTKITQAKPASRLVGRGRLDGAECHVDHFLKFLAREWMSHILWNLARKGTIRFGALRRAIPGSVSARILSRRLKELESFGLVSRHDAGKLPLQVEYRLTADGRRLDAALRRSETFTGMLKKRAAKKRQPADRSLQV